MVAGERLHSDTSTITKEVDSASFRADNPDLFPRDEAQRRSDVVAAVSRQQDWLKRAPEREAEMDTQRLVRRRIHQLETQDKVHEQLADLRNYQQFPEEGLPSEDAGGSRGGYVGGGDTREGGGTDGPAVGGDRDCQHSCTGDSYTHTGSSDRGHHVNSAYNASYGSVTGSSCST